MNDTELLAFLQEVDSSFRGDLTEPQEAALTIHLKDVDWATARRGLHLLISQGQSLIPTPGELVQAVAAARRADRPIRLGTGEGGVSSGTMWMQHQALIDRRRQGGPPRATEPNCDGDLIVQDDDGRRPVVTACNGCGEQWAFPQESERDVAYASSSDPF